MLLAAVVMVAAMGPGKEVCDGVRRDPIVSLGPNGVQYEYPKAQGCQFIDKDKSPAWYLDGTPSQQVLPAGTPCVRTMKRDHFTLGITELSDKLWVICEPKK